MLLYFLKTFVQGVLVPSPLMGFINLSGTFGTRLNIRIINLSAFGWQCLDRKEVGRPIP